MKLSKTILAVIATGAISCGLLTQTSQAIPVTGEIFFSGGVQLDQPLGTPATQVTAWISPEAGFGNSGSFAAVAPGTAATFVAPWSFNSGPIMNFWQVAGFSFSLLSSSQQMQTMTFLNVTGTGIISGNGFDPTFGTWSFTIPNGSPQGTIFTFAAASAAVPEGGSALALLGLALVVVEGVRRKLAKA